MTGVRKILLVVLAAGLLAGCGRAGSLQPGPDEQPVDADPPFILDGAVTPPENS